MTANVLLHILLVCHLLLLLRGDVVGLRHAASTGHVCLGRGNLSVVNFLGRLDVGLAIDTVLAALGRLGRVETGLQKIHVRRRVDLRESGDLTWIKFLPSALVTRGWSLGVVKV